MDTALFLAIIFLLECGVIFFLAHVITKQFSYLFLKITKSHQMSVTLLAAVFMPGVFVHEFSHYMMARVLGVHAGHMEFIPRVHNDKVKLGSVSISHTDPLRRFLIGVAPLLFGLGVISSLFWFYFSPILQYPVIKIILVGYGIFQVSTTMFSSKKDMEGSIMFGILLVVGIVLFTIVDRNALSHILFVLHILTPPIQLGSWMLAWVIGIDAVVVMIGKFLAKVLT